MQCLKLPQPQRNSKALQHLSWHCPTALWNKVESGILLEWVQNPQGLQATSRLWGVLQTVATNRWPDDLRRWPRHRPLQCPGHRPAWRTAWTHRGLKNRVPHGTPEILMVYHGLSCSHTQNIFKWPFWGIAPWPIFYFRLCKFCEVWIFIWRNHDI